MNKKIITISREFGSGGRTVGKLTAEKLGIACYDQSLIEELSAKSGFTKEYIAEKSEYASHGGWLANAFADRSVDGYSNQDYIWFIQRKHCCALNVINDCCRHTTVQISDWI